MSRPLRMSLSMDLDNKWSYLKTHGDESWQSYPGYLHYVVPRILDFLASREQRITFFIVGKDATLAQSLDALGQIAPAGHDIGNHSFRHEPWLHLYSEAELDEELERAEAAITSATGVRVKGFRGPGFSLSTDTLKVLGRRGYHYDATAFPNALNPLARAYFFSKSKLSAEEKRQRSALFGSFSDAFRPVKPYCWKLPTGPLLEIPVTTMPAFKIPIHFSYLLYLASFSRTVALAYTHAAIALCRATRTEPSLLLHPLDFMGAEDDRELAFFPAMSMPVQTKLDLMGELFDVLLNNFTSCTLDDFAATLSDTSTLRTYTPSFSHSLAAAR